MRTIILMLTLLWLGLSVLILPDIIRATAAAGNARLEAIQRLQQSPAYRERTGNLWF